MKRHIAHFALLVQDYDEAIEFYTKKLNFTLVQDTVLSETKRWVLIAPSSSAETHILLARVSNEEQISQVGYQSGGRVFLFLYTDNFQRDYQRLLEHKVTVVREPVEETWGTVAVFADLYGNLWDLMEPK
jgi:catechol 2,3-dioxygenase-like lactoylglutathione lyase family enzyme